MVTPRDAREFSIPEFSFAREGRFHSIRENLAILLAPVRLSAQAQGAQRFQIGSLWARPEKFGRAQWISLATHSLFIAVLAFSVTQTVKKVHDGGTVFTPWEKLVYPGAPPKLVVANDKTGSEGGSGGGGDRNPIPASAGQLARIARMQFTPPSLRPNPNAALQVEATLIGPPNVPMPKSPYPNYGEPGAPNLTNSGGPGGGNGFGKDGNGGVGPGGNKRGYGDDPDGDGVGKRIAGQGGASYPQCVYCPTPAYSEEGRKAKLQGQVELNVFVTADGRVDRVEIIRGLGLGLDESAMQMVRTWRFRPAHDGANRPVGVWVPIEVTFRLL
jgi:periplasmic protein TonB